MSGALLVVTLFLVFLAGLVAGLYCIMICLNHATKRMQQMLKDMPR